MILHLQDNISANLRLLRANFILFYLFFIRFYNQRPQGYPEQVFILKIRTLNNYLIKIFGGPY